MCTVTRVMLMVTTLVNLHSREFLFFLWHFFSFFFFSLSLSFYTSRVVYYITHCIYNTYSLSPLIYEPHQHTELGNGEQDE